MKTEEQYARDRQKKLELREQDRERARQRQRQHNRTFDASAHGRWYRRFKAEAKRLGPYEGQPCGHEYLGDCQGGMERAHTRYDDPMAFVWLCKRHHARFDRLLRRWTIEGTKRGVPSRQLVRRPGPLSQT